MQRFAVLFLLTMGILSAGRSWAGQMDSTGENATDPPKSTDPAPLPSEEVVTVDLPESVFDEFNSDFPVQETLESKPLMEVTDPPAGESGPSEEVKPETVEEPAGEEPQGDPEPAQAEVPEEFVELSLPPEEGVIQTFGPEGDMDILASQSGAAIQNTPEPSTLLLASLGASLIGARAYRRRRQETCS